MNYKLRGAFPYSFRALDKLEEFRAYVGVPLKVNSEGKQRRGARSMRELFKINQEIKGGDGWQYSFHLWCAFDITAEGITNDELYAKAIQFGKWGGVGRYDTFVHCDDRDNLNESVTTWDLRRNK